MQEQWKQIVDFPNYWISDHGRMKDVKGNIKVLQKNKGKEKEYLRVRLYNNGVKKKFYVHRLVGEYFIDGYSPELVINHKDGDTFNNHFENLEWSTQSENVTHWHYELKQK
jgi:HNH endonuclease/NUMOD4 motif